MEMNKEIEISSEADLDVAFKDGKLELSFSYEGKLGGAKVIVFTDAAKLVDKITDLTPTDWDDRVIDPLIEKLMNRKKVQNAE